MAASHTVTDGKHREPLFWLLLRHVVGQDEIQRAGLAPPWPALPQGAARGTALLLLETR